MLDALKTKLGRKINLTIVTSECDNNEKEEEKNKFYKSLKKNYSRSFNINVEPKNPDDLHDRHI